MKMTYICLHAFFDTAHEAKYHDDMVPFLSASLTKLELSPGSNSPLTHKVTACVHLENAWIPWIPCTTPPFQVRSLRCDARHGLYLAGGGLSDRKWWYKEGGGGCKCEVGIYK